MGTAGQLYTQDKIGNEPDAETMAGVELIYSNYSVDHFSYNIIGYWNDAEVISWNHKLQSTSNVDDQKSLGFELELKYKMALADIGFNYSVVKQLDWNLADGVSGSGISYSDYNQTLDIPNAIMTGVGNDVNNWPNQAIKIFAHSQLSDKISLYIDSRLQWDYQGAKGSLSSLSDAVVGLPEESLVQAALEKVQDAKVYDYDFRVNASLQYNFDNSLSVRIYVQNLLGRHDNKRYFYDTGNNRSSPKRVRVTEEPQTFGIRFDYQYQKLGKLMNLIERNVHD